MLKLSDDVLEEIKDQAEEDAEMFSDQHVEKLLKAYYEGHNEIDRIIVTIQSISLACLNDDKGKALKEIQEKSNAALLYFKP